MCVLVEVAKQGCIVLSKEEVWEVCSVKWSVANIGVSHSLLTGRDELMLTSLCQIPQHRFEYLKESLFNESTMVQNGNYECYCNSLATDY